MKIHDKKLARYAIATILTIHGALADASELSICVVPAINSTPILPQTNLSDMECATRVELSAAQGEYEAASFVLNSNEDVGNVDIIVSSLSDTRASIDARAIDVRYVKAWYQAGSAWSNIRQDRTSRKLVPELLLHDEKIIEVVHETESNFARIGSGSKSQRINISSATSRREMSLVPVGTFPIVDAPSIRPFDLKKNTNQQIWLTAHIPGSTPPGSYSGSIRITSAKPLINITVPFRVTVKSFSLAPSDLQHSIYYRGVLTFDNRGTISSDEKSESQLYADLVNMVEHGVSNPTLYQSPDRPDLFKRVLELRQDAGISNGDLFYLGINTGNYNALADLDRRYSQFTLLKAIAERFGNRSFYIYGVDEADFSAIEKQKVAWDRFSDLGGHIFAADWKKGLEKHYAGKLPLLVAGSPPANNANSALQKKGTRVFLYNQPQVGIENPYVYRLQYGLAAWQKGFNGTMNYAFQHSFGNIWNDFDHPSFRDHVFAYPTANGVVDTIAWEGFREGVDDVRYISTLRILAERSKSAENIEFLRDLKEDRLDDLDALRAEVAKRIEALCKKDGAATAQYCATSPPSNVTGLKVDLSE